MANTIIEEFFDGLGSGNAEAALELVTRDATTCSGRSGPSTASGARAASVHARCSRTPPPWPQRTADCHAAPPSRHRRKASASSPTRSGLQRAGVLRRRGFHYGYCSP
jgi:hypothetical protein